ncbi:hypothetical protein L7F22_039719 [Adiantum nelumboides]|nr:hypothetical protein [Adiantum nelumboides]
MENTSEKPSLAELKVEELLKEVRVEYPPHATVQGVLSALSSCFQQIPEHQVTSSLVSSFVEDLGVPADKAKFTFKSPMRIEIIGSYAIQTMAKPMQTMDLAVEIPKSCFHEKDFLNHRYHAKRALYLAVLQIHLKKCSFVKGTKWTSLHQDARKPLLLVQLGNELKVDFNFDICLVPVIGQDIFNVSKLVPSRNNIKISGSEVGSGATPHYNASILEDVDMQAHCLYLKDSLARNSSLRDTILLLKVWLRQRGLSNMSDSMNGFLSSMILAYLIHTGDWKITVNMSALQIFRIWIESLATGLLEKALFFNKESSGRIKEETRKYFEHYDVVMISTLKSCNIASRLSKNAIAEIKNAASATIAALKSIRDFAFDEIFMTPVDFSSKFDYHLRICMKDQPWKPPSFADEDKCRDVEKQVMRILSQGLGNRACLLRVYGRVPPSNWDLKEGMDMIRKLPIFVGVMVSDMEMANRMVDIGPSADNIEEAGKFRTFWGEKAELRRFKDGKINETAVWLCESTQRHLIIPNIAQYTLLRHLSFSTPLVHVCGGQLDHVLIEGENDSAASTPELLLAFDVLTKRLRGLESLPLKISSVQPLHPAFRHAAIFPPKVHALADERLRKGLSQTWVASCIDPLEVMVQLEGSGKWPTNQEAIEKTKLAFCLKIADSMCRTHAVTCVAAKESVDLLMHGFCFRLQLFYDKDPTLVHLRTEQVSTTKDVGSQQANGDTSPVTMLHKDISLQSLHSSMLGGLHGRYPIYGPTVRLAKRWIGSHLFSDVLREEAVELLVAYLFVNPAPYSPPLSRITGFLSDSMADKGKNKLPVEESSSSTRRHRRETAAADTQFMASARTARAPRPSMTAEEQEENDLFTALLMSMMGTFEQLAKNPRMQKLLKTKDYRTGSQAETSQQATSRQRQVTEPVERVPTVVIGPVQHVTQAQDPARNGHRSNELSTYPTIPMHTSFPGYFGDGEIQPSMIDELNIIRAQVKEMKEEGEKKTSWVEALSETQKKVEEAEKWIEVVKKGKGKDIPTTTTPDIINKTLEEEQRRRVRALHVRVTGLKDSNKVDQEVKSLMSMMGVEKPLHTRAWRVGRKNEGNGESLKERALILRFPSMEEKKGFLKKRPTLKKTGPDQKIQRSEFYCFAAVWMSDALGIVPNCQNSILECFSPQNRFLLLLRNYDWAFSPLVVDINGDFTAKEHSFIMDEFGQTRKQKLTEDAALQRSVMFIAAPYDLRSQTWTAHSPNKSILTRLIAYAKTSSELLDKLIKGEAPEKWPSLFCTPLKLFDIVLKVRPSKLAHPHRVLFPAEITAAVKVSIKAPNDGFQPLLPASALQKGVDIEKQLLLGFNPTVCFIEDLKKKFGDLFNYWYDHIGSRVICLSWKSSSEGAMKKRKRPQELEDIMIEVGRLGAGFIECVHLVDHT